MRLALISTPRSGNTWLRALIAALYGLKQFAVHDPASVDWAGLPDQSIVQVHWRWTEELARTLELDRIGIVCIARHPLDVLISILHFSGREPDTRQWLLGQGDGEASIRGLSPAAHEFNVYSTSKRAHDLLMVTPDWWARSSVVKVRYESLVGSTKATLDALVNDLGPGVADVEAVVDAHTLVALRATSSNDHFWQGKPGLWQLLLTKDQAEHVARAHRVVFESLGYSTDRTTSPSMEETVAAWLRLKTPSTA